MTDIPEVERQRALINQLCEALRLTREYVGEDLLPAKPGWSWYDALLAAGRIEPVRELSVEERVANQFVDRLVLAVQPKIDSRWYTKPTALAVIDQAREVAQSFAASVASCLIDEVKE